MQHNLKLTAADVHFLESAISDALYKLSAKQGRMTTEEREAHTAAAQSYTLSLEVAKSSPAKGKGKEKELISE